METHRMREDLRAWGHIGTEAYFYKLRRVDYGVPCDDAAIERAAQALWMVERRTGAETWAEYAERLPGWAGEFRDKARAALVAAGETP